ncbi:MAG: AMP-binding protein [Campylobacterales bacterium]|nr:AMP-binding protein [Campylobacterales bacterium]
MSKITLIYDDESVVTKNILIREDFQEHNPSLSIITNTNKLDQVDQIIKTLNRGDIPVLFDHAMHSSAQKAQELCQKNLSGDNALPDDTKIIIFTSGTTGNPIGVLKNQKNIESEVKAQLQWLQKWNFKQCLVTVPFFHIYGFLFGFSIPLAMQLDIITKEHFLPNEILDICSNKPTLCITNPVFIRSMLKGNYSYTLTNTLFISSSGPLEPYEAEAFEKKYKTTLMQIYGSSETGGVAKRSSNEIFWTPLQDVSIATIEDILYVDSPYTSHYVYDDTLTKIASPYKTTEMVALQDERFKITGRVVEIVKIGGKRLSVVEMERFLEDMDSIDEALVEATYDPKNIRGETLTIYVVSKNKNINKRHIKRSMHDFFGGVHIECKIIISDYIPKTSLGKKIRKPLLSKGVK